MCVYVYECVLVRTRVYIIIICIVAGISLRSILTIWIIAHYVHAYGWQYNYCCAPVLVSHYETRTNTNIYIRYSIKKNFTYYMYIDCRLTSTLCRYMRAHSSVLILLGLCCISSDVSEWIIILQYKIIWVYCVRVEFLYYVYWNIYTRYEYDMHSVYLIIITNNTGAGIGQNITIGMWKFIVLHTEINCK